MHSTSNLHAYAYIGVRMIFCILHAGSGTETGSAGANEVRAQCTYVDLYMGVPALLHVYDVYMLRSTYPENIYKKKNTNKTKQKEKFRMLKLRQWQ